MSAWLAKMSDTDTLVGKASTPITAHANSERRATVPAVADPASRPATAAQVASATAPTTNAAIPAPAPDQCARATPTSRPNNTTAPAVADNGTDPRPTTSPQSPITASRIPPMRTWNAVSRYGPNRSAGVLHVAAHRPSPAATALAPT